MYLCSVWFLQQTVITSIYSLNNLVFTIEALCIPCVICVTWLMTWEGGGKIENGYWELRCLFSEPCKTRVFSFFLSLHHQNNSLQNVTIFYLPLFNSVAQKTPFLGRKKNIGSGGGRLPPLHRLRHAYVL